MSISRACWCGMCVLGLLSFSAFGDTRLFMIEGGDDPTAAPAVGNTELALNAGEAATIEIWVLDDAQTQELNSYLFVLNTTLDWKVDLMGAAFKFENPQATGTCGCGQSFYVDK